MIVIFLGAPGAGKGTQSLRAANAAGVPHISTGDIFRENIKNKTELGKLAESYISKGALVPDDVTVSLIEKRTHEKDCEKGFILDGFPRTSNQAKLFGRLLKKDKKELSVVINLDIKDEALLDRLVKRRVCPKCGASYHLTSLKPKKDGICDECGTALVQREDDREEVILQRLATYHEQTQPLIKYYKRKKLLVNIDGDRPVDTILKEVMKVIGS
ncbi:MAG: adenylate kinase [Clostridia bacterium]|nr:adenylate kinase [Clostridia bacterium]